MFISLKQHSSL